jgi:fibronectin-binding autotransporter adhesin
MLSKAAHRNYANRCADRLGIPFGRLLWRIHGLTIATLGVAGGSGVFSGAIGDDSGAHLAIVKSGNGTQTFTGSNIYSGGTTISGGALAIGATGGLPTGSPVFNNA